jgi:hypothetical protein
MIAAIRALARKVSQRLKPINAERPQCSSGTLLHPKSFAAASNPQHQGELTKTFEAEMAASSVI